jgi:hypothetical protein
MSRGEWLKVIVLLLVPINAWLGMLYYLHWQRWSSFSYRLRQSEQERAMVVRYLREKQGLHFKVGQRIPYPFPYPLYLIGNSPPVGRGEPVIFLNISWIASLEVWEPALKEILSYSPPLQLVLLYRKPLGLDDRYIREMVQRLKSPYVSALVGEDEPMRRLFDSEVDRVLLIICDGKGIIRHLEYYPDLKLSPYWREEVSDWRPKLHQAVKRALERFYGKPSGAQGR